DEIHTPGVYVQHVFVGENYEKRIERKMTRQEVNV
ncbi:MAG TPA: succinyl-CoA--3-ketoacid-CoA transferase, partial [Ureibacillus sp.]|nr:succinyl-CoA--3-ketoacid-CoA transferase [Ureibacillus sp.]